MSVASLPPSSPTCGLTPRSERCVTGGRPVNTTAPNRTATGTVRPRLLVSVRDAVEAELALEAGVDVLDVKEPAYGSLGRAAPDVLRAVLAARDLRQSSTPVSAALGELREFGRESSASLSLPTSGLAYVKLGLSGMGHVSGWREDWRCVRESVTQHCVESPRWVAVAYADASAAAAPAPEAVIDAAVEAGCAGLLFDTWCKNSPGLLHQFGLPRLQELVQRVRTGGLFCAAAGRLHWNDLEQLQGLPLDLLAVRSAVCHDGQRTAPLCEVRLRRLCAAIREFDSLYDFRPCSVGFPQLGNC